MKYVSFYGDLSQVPDLSPVFIIQEIGLADLVCEKSLSRLSQAPRILSHRDENVSDFVISHTSGGCIPFRKIPFTLSRDLQKVCRPAGLLLRYSFVVQISDCAINAL